MATLSGVIAFIPLCISCVSLWKGHFARFAPLALAGNLQHRVYPIRSGDDRWYITSFDTPVSVTNPGARPGFVTGIRLRLHYPELPFPGNFELIFPNWELNLEKLKLIDTNRFVWIDEVVSADWSPFIILPKATIVKHLLFEATWETPVEKRVVATLQLQVDRRKEWVDVTEWELGLRPETWVDLENGKAAIYDPDKGQARTEIHCFPADLHKYTGTKAALPTRGALTGMPPSYLDYPKSKED